MGPNNNQLRTKQENYLSTEKFLTAQEFVEERYNITEGAVTENFVKQRGTTQTGYSHVKTLAYSFNMASITAGGGGGGGGKLCKEKILF